MSVPVGSAGVGAPPCRFCGLRPVMEMYRGRPGGEGICVSCMSRITGSFAADTGMILGGGRRTVEGERGAAAGEGGTFEAFQEAWNSNSVARSVAVYADAGEDEIETVLYGEAGDDSADRVTRQVELVRTLLVGRGYEEIVVTIGIDVDLAAAGQLGGFHQVPDPDRPRWAAHVMFRRSRP